MLGFNCQQLIWGMYIWHEIGLEMTAMTIKLQLSESALGTITVATATTVYGQVLIIAISQMYLFNMDSRDSLYKL